MKTVYYIVDSNLGVEKKSGGRFGSYSTWERENDLSWGRKDLLGEPEVGGNYTDFQ